VPFVQTLLGYVSRRGGITKMNKKRRDINLTRIYISDKLQHFQSTEDEEWKRRRPKRYQV